MDCMAQETEHPPAALSASSFSKVLPYLEIVNWPSCFTYSEIIYWLSYYMHSEVINWQ